MAFRDLSFDSVYNMSSHAGAAEHSAVGSLRPFLCFGHALHRSCFDAGNAFKGASALCTVA